MNEKKLLVMIVPILLQSFIAQCSESEFYLAIMPSLQSAHVILKNPMISIELDSVVNGLLSSVQSGTISKEAALDRLNAIKNALREFTKRQYTSNFYNMLAAWWSYRFGPTPDIVTNKVYPAMRKVKNAIYMLEDHSPNLYAIAGIAVGAVALAGGGYGIYKWREGCR